MSAVPNLYTETRKAFGHEVNKVEAHKWEMVDRPGVFMSIRKRDLRVDPEYQREKVSNGRVLAIASAWSWLACGCLLVARRPDDSYWVYDGQHRKLAADKRSDIQELPCLVFNVEGKPEEAAGFVRANTVRGSMSAFNKFRGLLCAADETAIAIKQMVEDFGYVIADTGADNCVSFVAALTQEFNSNSEDARHVFGLCARLAQGKPFPADLFKSLCLLEKFLRRERLPSLADDTYFNRINELGIDGLMDAIRRSCVYHGKGGAKVGAEGICNALNKGRRSRRIPSLLNTDDAQED